MNLKPKSQYINHLVLADDDRDLGILFERVLKQIDPIKSFTSINDGESLLAYLSDHTPDLLFLDLNMPCKNGLECLTEIRKEPRLSNLPIIVYSSSTNMVDIHRSYIHKADLYMVKPFNTEHLKNALQSILNMKWREDNSNQKFYFINNRFVPFTAHSV